MAFDLLTSSSLVLPSTKNTPLPPPDAVAAYSNVALFTELGVLWSLSLIALSITKFPVPAGITLISSFVLALVILKPFVSKSPPSCGVVSSTTLLIPPLPVVRLT